MTAYYENIIVSDDEESLYDYTVPTAPRRPRSRSRVLRVVDEKYQQPPVPPRVKPQHYYSYNDAASGIEREPESIVVQNHLNIPGVARPRALSTGGSPAPNVVYVAAPREVSQTRIKNYRGKGKHHADDSSSEEAEYKAHKRKMDAEAHARLKYLEKEERRRAEAERMQELMNPLMDKLKVMDPDSKKAAWAAQIKEDARRDEERKERMHLEYEEEIRRRQRAEEDAVTRAEAARARAQAEADAQRDRVIASEREKAAAAAAKQKAETARILAEAKDKAAAEKAEREQMIAEARYKMEKEKKEQAEERARIIAEEKAKAKKDKEDHEAEVRRILAEEAERKKKEKEEWEETKARVMAEKKKEEEEAKAKKKAEDDAFKLKVKEQFMAVGYSPDYIEDILDKRDRKGSTSNSSKNNMAIALARPTFIRVQLKHLLPETLDAYHLPWEFDPNDTKYILIKEYIDHDFQQVLFQHTKKILRKRDMLITDGGYTKETVTTLKPNIYKVKDGKSEETYLVRRKSTGKSPSRPRNWMFT